MSSTVLNKHEYNIRDLSTESVTFTPDQAEVTRNITGIRLKPGLNEVVITGITPSAIEDSIKVDGIGSASITDLTVNLVNNPEDFEDIYPPSDSDDDSPWKIDDEDSDDEGSDIKTLNAGLKKLWRSVGEERSKIETATDELKLLNHLYGNIQEYDIEKIVPNAYHYAQRRNQIESSKRQASINLEGHQEQIKKMTKQRDRHRKKIEESKKESEKLKRKEEAKKRREQKRKADARAELRAQRTSFWPRQVYKLVITLESQSGFTPGSSRRASVDSFATQLQQKAIQEKATQEKPTEKDTVSLCLTYITKFASWIPRYDLHINTQSSTAQLVYRAETRNMTSEEWKDAKVILSTSRTSSIGLFDTIPQLLTWNIKLARGNSIQNQAHAQAAMKSNQEGPSNRHTSAPQSVKPHNQLFGLGPVSNANSTYPFAAVNKMMANNNNSQQMQQMQQRHQKPQAGGLFGAPAASGFGGSAFRASSAFGTNATAPGGTNSNTFGAYGSNATAQTSLFSVGGGGGYDEGSDPNAPIPPPPPAPSGARGSMPGETTEEEDAFDDSATVAPMALPEAEWEDTGLTSTYEVPGARTITPSNTHRRLRINSIELSKLSLWHITIPKLRPVAFLKARLHNLSNVVLLKGTAGLTLDGSFLGSVNVPRCEAGDSFPLSLGIDPSVQIVSQPPAMKKNLQSGMLNKQDSNIYERVVLVKNTKTSGAPLDLTVLDQVPVSQDEKLKVDIIKPAGLRLEGGGVAAGETVRNDAKGPVAKEDRFGKAVAEMKRNGQVEWKVKLNPSTAVKLALSYETRYPAGDVVVSSF